MQITQRLYVGLWKNVNIPMDDAVSISIHRYFNDKLYVAWKTLKAQS